MMNTMSLLKECRCNHGRALILLAIFTLFDCSQSYSKSSLIDERPFVSKERGVNLVCKPITVFPLRNSTGKPELDWVSIGLQENLTVDLYYVSELHTKALLNFSRLIKEHCHEVTLSCVTGLSAGATTNCLFKLSDWQAIATDAKLGQFLWGEYQLQGDDVRVNLRLYGGEKWTLQGETVIKTPLAKLLQESSKQTLRFLETKGIAVKPEESERILSTKTKSVTAWKQNAMGYWRLQKYFMSEEEQKKTISEKSETAFKKAVEIDPYYAEAWCKLGYQRLVTGNLDSAIEAFQKALDLKSYLVDAHIGLGYCLVEKDDTRKAISHLEQVVGLNPSLSDYYDFLMGLYNNAKLWQEGLNTLGKLEYFLRVRNREAERMDVVLWQAIFLQGLNDFVESEKAYREVLLFKEKNLGSEHPEVATTLNNLAFLYKSRGEYNQAESLYERALTIDKKVNGDRHPNTARDLNNLGELYYVMGQYDKAKPLHEHALSIYEEVYGPKVIEVATVVSNLALLYQAVGDYDKAKPLYERALTIHEEICKGEHPNVAKSLSNLGEYYYVQGKYDKAKPLFERALGIDKKAYGYEHPDVAQDLSNLAALYFAQGKYDRAKLLYERALAIYDAVYEGEHPDEGKTLNNIAELYRTLGNYDEAKSLYERALTICEKIYGFNHPSVAILLNNLAELYCDLGEYDQAESLYERALSIYKKVYSLKHPHVATAFNNLAGIYYVSNKYDKAKPLYEHALEIDEDFFGQYHPQVSIRLNNLAELYSAMGDYDRAKPLYERALTIAQMSGQPELLWRIQFNLSYLLAKQGNPRAAILLSKQAVNNIQKLRVGISNMQKELQKSFLQSKWHVYKFLVDLLIDLGRIPEAQQVMSMQKEEALFDFLCRDANTKDVRTTFATYNDEEQYWVEPYQKINVSLASLGREFAELKQKRKFRLTDEEKKRHQQIDNELKILQKELHNYLTELIDELRGIKEQEKVKELRMLVQKKQLLRELGNGAVAINYYITNDKLHIILTTPEIIQARFFDILSKELNRKIMDFRVTLQNPQHSPLFQAQELYRIILAPVAEDLRQAEAKTLMLSLDGALNYLPIGALHDGEHYVAELYPLSIYNTESKLVIKDKPTKGWRVGGLGLSKAVLNLDPLPNVPSELEGIVRHGPLDPDGVLPGVIYLDESFTQEAIESVLQEEYPVMHIASHFELIPGTIQNSSLVLGNGMTLSLAKMREYGYDFGRVEMLTLSACNTAVIGTVGNGSEVESFGSLAQMQGAKGVLATLWPVIDQSTGIFMQNFYRIRDEKPSMTKVEALRQAQLLFIYGGGDNPDPNAPYAHPYYWSPFILMGNWL